MKRICPKCGKEMSISTVSVGNLANAYSKLPKRRKHWHCVNCGHKEEITEKS